MLASITEFPLSKVEIRQALLSRRRAIPAEERKNAAERATRHFITHPLFQANQHIACYLSRPDEFDCEPMILAVWEAKKIGYLPVISSAKEIALEFVRYDRNDALQLNRYHILEPTKKATSLPSSLDLVLVPLVGWDNKGHRLGMGGGYYDKTFSFLREKKDKKPFLLGVGFEAQCVESLPQDSWDITLDGMLTEKALYQF